MRPSLLPHSALPLALLALTALAPATAQAPAQAQTGLPAPLAYVQNLEPIEGQTLVLKQVSCQAEGKPDTLGRLYLKRRSDGKYQTARVEYNEQGKYILEHGRNTPKVIDSFNKYVYQRQPFSLGTFNFLVGLWRVFGLHFSLEDVTYRCQMK